MYLILLPVSCIICTAIGYLERTNLNWESGTIETASSWCNFFSQHRLEELRFTAVHGQRHFINAWDFINYILCVRNSSFPREKSTPVWSGDVSLSGQLLSWKRCSYGTEKCSQIYTKKKEMLTMWTVTFTHIRYAEDRRGVAGFNGVANGIEAENEEVTWRQCPYRCQWVSSAFNGSWGSKWLNGKLGVVVQKKKKKKNAECLTPSRNTVRLHHNHEVKDLAGSAAPSFVHVTVRAKPFPIWL